MCVSVCLCVCVCVCVCLLYSVCEYLLYYMYVLESIYIYIYIYIYMGGHVCVCAFIYIDRGIRNFEKTKYITEYKYLLLWESKYPYILMNFYPSTLIRKVTLLIKRSIICCSSTVPSGMVRLGQ